jgi:ABC-type transport system substrate-binding protein
MLIVSLIIIATADAAYAGPGGHIPWAEHTSVVPGWLDPGESDDGNHAITSALSRIRWSMVKSNFDFYWQSPGHRYEPSRAKQLLTEAGYSNGFDAGELFCDLQASATAEAVADYLNAVGIRTKLRPLERAAFFGGLAVVGRSSVSASPTPTLSCTEGSSKSSFQVNTAVALMQSSARALMPP